MVNKSAHGRRPRVTTPAQDRYMRLQHLRDRVRPATRTAAEIAGLHNRRISAQTVRNLRARRPQQVVDLRAARRRMRLNWAYDHVRWTLAHLEDRAVQ